LIALPSFKDAASSFADHLEALAAQRLAGEWEVVLVDNGSRDDPEQSANASWAGLNLRIVDASDWPGAASARNVGVRTRLEGS
jgi:glycosyltransferase involved in cell wall biosynthesis